MEQDRADLVTAIIKLKDTINELNQKGRERLTDAFDKVNRKFNEVYTKLFNGGNAKLELVASDDPLEAGLEMLVSHPGKRLQSIKGKNFQRINKRFRKSLFRKGQEKKVRFG